MARSARTSGWFDLTKSSKEVEEGLAFMPKFDADGLISAVVTDAKSGDVLMVDRKSVV